MFKKILILGLSIGAILLVGGCAKVPMEPQEVSASAKEFSKPSEGNAGLYIYRGSGVGSALKKDIFIDNKCLGQSAPNVFFYQAVKGDMEHEIATESEFSPNKILINPKNGKNYFIRQYIKMGVFVGGANLQIVNEDEGKKAILSLEMAKKGTCAN